MKGHHDLGAGLPGTKSQDKAIRMRKPTAIPKAAPVLRE